MYKVIVITVCRNAGALLEPTMLSVLGQTYKNLQYIIVDGASTDGTVEVVKKYENQLTAWISEPDKGIYDAMNKGLRMINHLIGERENVWVNFLNAGDSFSDNKVLDSIFGNLAILDSSENKNGSIVIGGDTINLFPDGSTTIHHAEMPDLLPERLIFSHQACFVKYGGSNDPYLTPWKFDTKYKYAADYKLLLSIYKKYGKDAFLIVNKAIACYRKEGSVSLLNQKRTRYEYLRIQSEWTSFRWWKEILKLLIWIIFKKRI